MNSKQNIPLETTDFFFSVPQQLPWLFIYFFYFPWHRSPPPPRQKNEVRRKRKMFFLFE